jgi:hypothetical protein
VQYERPSIVRREPIGDLLADTVPSDQQKDAAISDVRRKVNIRPVVWTSRVAYERPGINRRERLDGLLGHSGSDLQKDV